MTKMNTNKHGVTYHGLPRRPDDEELVSSTWSTFQGKLYASKRNDQITVLVK